MDGMELSTAIEMANLGETIHHSSYLGSNGEGEIWLSASSRHPHQYSRGIATRSHRDKQILYFHFQVDLVIRVRLDPVLMEQVLLVIVKE
jgi:hypothetical protein